MKKAVAIILRNNKNEILLMQRGPHARSQNGKWENCGGEVDHNETPLEAIKREVEEELGVREIDPKVLFVTKSNDATIWEVTLYESRLTTTPKILEPDQCAGIRWVFQEQLHKLALCSYTREDFEKLGYINKPS